MEHFCLFVFETEFLCIALEPVLALSLYARLALNTQRSTCLCLPSTGIKGMNHHCLRGLQNKFRVNLGYLVRLR